MAMYLIGDVQGCDHALGRLLSAIDFSPSRDTLYLLGDLVNRGRNSARVLRRIIGFGGAAHCVLGNHDLHLLAVSAGARKLQRNDTVGDILQADDCESLLSWLRHQHLALRWSAQGRDLLMVHAGVLPQWTVDQTLALAAEVESALRAVDYRDFLHGMYGNAPVCWDPGLAGADRLRVVVNALTRLRFCTAAGVMEFASKEGAEAAPDGYSPWFDIPGRATAGAVVAFGHWSTLGWQNRPDVLALDSGCVWGGKLSALTIDLALDFSVPQLHQVDCPAEQSPF